MFKLRKQNLASLESFSMVSSTITVLILLPVFAIALHESGTRKTLLGS